MLEAVIIGRGRSTPGLFSIRRRILRLRRFNWRWTLAFTRKPPGGRTVEGVKYLDCSLKPGGFRASCRQTASDYAWVRASRSHAGVGRAVLRRLVSPVCHLRDAASPAMATVNVTMAVRELSAVSSIE